MTFYKIIFLTFIQFQFLSYYSQNLVLNPSFEDNKRRREDCPTLFSLNGVNDWKQVTAGSVDYYKNGVKCSRKSHKTKSHTGNRYIGEFSVVSKFRKYYREYFQGRFIKPLQKGKEYNIEFYVLLSEWSKIAVSDMGAYINDAPIYRKGVRRLKLHPQIKSELPVTNKNDWTKISGVYTAIGGEKYITIGNFQKYRKLKKSITNSGYFSSYYYIDDVSVTEITEEFKELRKDSLISIENSNISVLPSIDDSILLSSVQFETNSYNLIDSTTKELDKLVNYLLLNPFLKIDVLGHTDSIGSKRYNDKLSLNRAISIKTYLINKGISVNRIKTIGYGASKPIASNTTKEGRKKNRRIEIVIKDVYNLYSTHSSAIPKPK